MTKESLLKVQGSQTVQSNQFLLAQMLGSACGQMPADLPAYLPAECPQFTHIFAYSASGPAFDADFLTDNIDESDDYV